MNTQDAVDNANSTITAYVDSYLRYIDGEADKFSTKDFTTAIKVIRRVCDEHDKCDQMYALFKEVLQKYI